MKHKISFSILILTLIFCIVSPISAEFTPDPAIVDFMSPFTCSDISAQAAAEGKMHFYFMAGEGLRTSSTEDVHLWGDSCLIAFPNGTLMLIDLGMPEYTPLLTANLKQLGVEKIDILVITHPHDDHAGTLYTTGEILNDFEFGEVWHNGTYNQDWANPKIMEELLDAHGIPHKVVDSTFSTMIGDVSLRVLNPGPEEAGKTFGKTKDINNRSIVMRMDYNEFSALFTADIYSPQEAKLVYNIPELLDADLLKIPHHGNRTSSTPDFAAAVSPKLAVATGGLAFPEIIYKNYAELGSKVLFDRGVGYVHVVSDGSGLEYEQSHEQIFTNYAKYDR